MENIIIPEFGPLRGVRVLGTGSLIAMPFAISMMAEFGAQVIQIERPGVGDNYRFFPPVAQNEHGRVGASWVQEARNRLSMTLELKLDDPDCREIFMGLIRNTDIYIENLVWLEKLGIRDEDLLRENPALSIIHISGFGHEEFGGDTAICDRASYDMIGQAFSGYVLNNGYPDRPPLLTKPALSDYITALFSLFGALSAYISAQKTGKGQVVDVSQFEAQAKIMRDAFTKYSLGLGKVEREGSIFYGCQPWNLFFCKDGSYVAIGAFGPNVYKRFTEGIGLSLEEYPFELVARDRAAVCSSLGRDYAKKVDEWCAAHTATEIETILAKVKVPCSRINDAEDCMSHPQFLQRGDFIEYEDQTLRKKVTALGVVPKMSETPGSVWRGAPSVGQDTDRILSEILGYSQEKIRKLREKKII